MAALLVLNRTCRYTSFLWDVVWWGGVWIIGDLAFFPGLDWPSYPALTTNFVLTVRSLMQNFHSVRRSFSF